MNPMVQAGWTHVRRGMRGRLLWGISFGAVAWSLLSFVVTEVDCLNGQDQLWKAVRTGDTRSARYLLRSGVRPSDANLIGAISLHDTRMATLLLTHGANPNAPVGYAEGQAFSVLGIAAYQSNNEAVQLLLAHSAHPNDGPRGRTSFALSEAVKVGNVRAVRLLLEAGANPESPREAYERSVSLEARRQIDHLLTERE